MSTSDRDECAGLVEEIWCSLPESPHIRHRDARAIARSVYNSDWLAAREVEAGARALEEVADARVINLVSAWTGGWHDEGVEYEQASEWAEEAAEWPRYWIGGRRNIHPAERLAARNWLARAAGGEGE